MENNTHEEVSPARTLVERFIGLLNKIWTIRFVRFLFVGGINTLFGYLVFSILILLQIHYAVASLFSTILGVLFNFFTTGRIVFKNNDPKLVFRFFGTYGLTYIIGVLLLMIFDFYRVNMLIAGAILIFPGAMLSYFLNRKLVFNT